MWGTRSNNFKITERRNRVNTEIPLETSISAIRHVLEDGGRPDTSDATAAKARTGMVLAPMSEDLTTLLARRVMGWDVAPERFLTGKRRWMPRWRFRPTENLEDAFRLLEQAGPEEYTMGRKGREHFWARVKIGGTIGEARAGSKPQAITLAVARALGIDAHRQ